jgi:hypothetical protein
VFRSNPDLDEAAGDPGRLTDGAPLGATIILAGLGQVRCVDRGDSRRTALIRLILATAAVYARNRRDQACNGVTKIGLFQAAGGEGGGEGLGPLENI